MGLLKSTVFVCLDCEMTGLDVKKDRIIEVAAVRFTFDQIFDTFESLVDPEQEVSKESQKIHHISNEMLQGKPKISTVLQQLTSFLKEGDLIVGHNIGFDLEVLSQEAERVKHKFISKYTEIDTLRLAKEYGDSPNNSLESLASHFNVEYDKAHRAMNDVEINISIFKHFCKRYKTLEQILKLLSRPIKMKYMPLGKYKGRLFSDIPIPYLRWASKMDFDRDLLYSISQEIKLRQKGLGFNQNNNPFLNVQLDK